MADRLVINTGPLIALARAEALEVVAALPIEIIAPLEVQAELEAGVAAGHPWVSAPFVRFLPLSSALNPIAIANLDIGEAAVIQLALDQAVAAVCIDERKGRRAATAIGLRVTGTLGLLGRAKTMGIIQAVRPFVDRLSREGEWFDAALVARVLAGLGE